MTDAHTERQGLRIRVLVAAGTRLYREGLAALLAREATLAVVGTAADAGAALAATRNRHPDVVLFDIALVGSDAALRDIVVAAPATRVVAFGILEDPEIVIACAEAGVAGYVPRDASLDELVSVVQSVARDEMPCSPRMARTLLGHIAALAELRREDQGAAGLTRRELEIVALVDEGLSNREIAARLHIELATVKNHVHHILEKLHVERRGQAAARVRALRDGGATASVGAEP